MTERERKMFHLLAHSPRDSNSQLWAQPGVRRSTCFSQVSVTGPNTLPCFPRYINRELDWKKGSPDMNRCPLGMLLI